MILMVKDRGVSVKLSKNFFNNVFEPERKKLETKLGVKVGQLDFTEFLSKKQVKFSFPPPSNVMLMGRKKVKMKGRRRR